jgi:hypothetical protein
MAHGDQAVTAAAGEFGQIYSLETVQLFIQDGDL